MVCKKRRVKEINSKTILVCRTKHDWEIKYPYYWCEEVMEYAESKGFKVAELKDKNFVQTKFNDLIKEENPFFVFASGHGESWVLKGNNDQYVIEACKNDILLKNRIVYSLSCYTAKILSESAIKKGCKCFISYSGKFSFITQSPNPKNPLRDRFARAFMEVSNQIPLTLIGGGTPEEAWKNSRDKCDEWVDKWSKQKLKIAPQIIGALLLNRKRQSLK